MNHLDGGRQWRYIIQPHQGGTIVIKITNAYYIFMFKET